MQDAISVDVPVVVREHVLPELLNNLWADLSHYLNDVWIIKGRGCPTHPCELLFALTNLNGSVRGIF